MFFSNIFKKNKKNIEKDTKEVKNQVENYNEYDVCNYFIEELIKLGKDDTLFRIEQRSDRYLSLIYGNNNFLRVHISKVDDTKWITIAMFNSYRKKYIDSELFLAQTNKNQIHWKADIQDFNDLKKFIDIANEACVILKECGQEPLTEDEEKIGKYLEKLYLECGAEKGNIYFRHLSDHAEIYYIEWPTKIKFKVYKKKKSCIWLYFSEIAKELKVEKEEIVLAIDSMKQVDSIYEEDSENNKLALIDRVSSEKDETDTMINRIFIKELLNKMDSRDRQIIMLRYFNGKTQSQVAKMLNISQVQVSRIEKKILNKMKIELIS